MIRDLEKIYGHHPVRSVILSRPEEVRRVIIADGQGPQKGKPNKITKEYIKLTEKLGVKPELLPWDQFDRAGGFGRDDKHQGICVFVKPRKIYTESDLDSLKSGRLVVALDQITNPQNLGTILRSAAFFGVDALLLLKNRAANITPEVARVASGGAEFVKVYQVTNLARSLEKLKEIEYWVYGLDERGTSDLADTNFADKTVIVIGAEGEGLRQKTKQYCDELVCIPGGRAGVESLNAGVAASVAIADICRRPQFRPGN